MDYQSDEDLAWVVPLVQELEWMDGFPRSPEGLRGWLRRVLPIIGDRDRGQWLFDEISEGCDRFPSVFQTRQLYENKYIPADGRRADDIGARMDRAVV